MSLILLETLIKALGKARTNGKISSEGMVDILVDVVDIQQTLEKSSELIPEIICHQKTESNIDETSSSSPSPSNFLDLLSEAAISDNDENNETPIYKWIKLFLITNSIDYKHFAEVAELKTKCQDKGTIIRSIIALKRSNDWLKYHRPSIVQLYQKLIANEVYQEEFIKKYQKRDDDNDSHEKTMVGDKRKMISTKHS